MSELEKMATEADAVSAECDPAGVGEPAPGDCEELGLDVIEGLAEEAHVTAESGELEMPAEDRGRAVDAAALVDAIGGLSGQLSRRIDALQTTFERELRAEATRERVVDRLHAELQEYKQDFLLKVQRPIFIDLIQLHDDIGKMVDARTKPPGVGDQTPDLRALLEPIQTAIEDILYRQGVEPFAVEGTEFDPRRQRAISTQATDDPALNKHVAARVRKGFCSGDKLIRPEIVTVFTFRPSPLAASE
jgi:molecular chaperone GrpE